MDARHNTIWTLASLVGVACAVWLALKPNAPSRETPSGVDTDPRPAALSLPRAEPRVRDQSSERASTRALDDGRESVGATQTRIETSNTEPIDPSQRDGSRRPPRWFTADQPRERHDTQRRDLAPKERITALAARLREQPADASAQQRVAEWMATYLRRP